MLASRVAEEAVAHEIDHVVDGVEVGQGRPRLGQQRRRVEHPAEKDQRRQHEGLSDRHIVELLGTHPDQHAQLREEEPDQEQPGYQDQDVLDRQVDQKRRGDEGEHGHDRTAGEAAKRKRGQQLERGRRRGELILDRALELLLEDRRGVVGERVHRPGHHDQAWDDEDHVFEAVQRVDARAQRGSEHRDVEERLEQRRANRLPLDLHEAVHLPPPEAEEADLRSTHTNSSSTFDRDSSLRPTNSRYASSRLETP